MLFSFWAVVRAGHIVPLENVQLPENARVLVTISPDEEAEIWESVSASALKAVWENEEDDVYTEIK